MGGQSEPSIRREDLPVYPAPQWGKGPAYVLGETEFGQVFQNETSVVGVYQIPANSKYPFLKGWIPTKPVAVINSTESSGKLFLHYGHTAIALQLSEKFSWTLGDENFFIRDKGEVGFALEVYPANSLGGGTAQEQLQNLAQKIESNSKMTLDFSGIPTIKYVDTKGQTLETRLHNGDFLNGSKIDYSQWPLLKNPWIEQAFEGNILTVKIDGQQVEYDFDKWEKR